MPEPAVGNCTMNEEEAELLPPYLRPYPPVGAPLGTLSYNRRSKCWVV